HGFRGPGVPFVDMQVRAANGGLADLDEHVVGPDVRHRRLDHPDAFLGFFFAQGFPVYFLTPSSRPTFPKAAMAWSRCARSCAADIWVRMRALSFGTTG